MNERLSRVADRIRDELNPVKVQRLVCNAPSTFSQVRMELLAFADFLEASTATLNAQT